MATQSQHSTTPVTQPCDVCGEPAELIPYQDVAGCGIVTIELWRCPNGHARYGDITEDATCDISPDTSS
jgi:hypothetical protein